MWSVDDMPGKLNAERLHYSIIRNLADNNDFNAVKYLYDRLNIIDAKAQGLLTRNGLLLTVVSIVGSAKLKAGAPNGDTSFLGKDWEQWIFALGFLSLVISTVSTLYWMFFRFDNVTSVPSSVRERMEKRCKCKIEGKVFQNGEIPADCTMADECGFATAIQVEPTIIHAHSLSAYEDLFFMITIERQERLRFAQYFTFLASILFFTLIGYIFWDIMPYLHLRAA